MRVAAPMRRKVVPLEPVSASWVVVSAWATCSVLSVPGLLFPQSTLSPVRVQVLSFPPVVEAPPVVELAGGVDVPPPDAGGVVAGGVVAGGVVSGVVGGVVSGVVGGVVSGVVGGVVGGVVSGVVGGVVSGVVAGGPPMTPRMSPVGLSVGL
jgi:hypothetical protein